MVSKKSIVIRNIELSDLEAYYQWNLPTREFHKYNGPYFGKLSEAELRLYVEELRDKLNRGNQDAFGQKKIIADAETNEIIGTVNWYWKSIETLWMEIGIVIFNEDYWGKGIGFVALEKWTSEIFETHKELVRLGLTTWSGNHRMMNLAEKLSYTCEAVYRKARLVNGAYYDSISYGILREEWENRKGSSEME